jgi:hypothetical protein
MHTILWIEMFQDIFQIKICYFSLLTMKELKLVFLIQSIFTLIMIFCSFSVYDIKTTHK